MPPRVLLVLRVFTLSAIKYCSSDGILLQKAGDCIVVVLLIHFNKFQSFVQLSLIFDDFLTKFSLVFVETKCFGIDVNDDNFDVIRIQPLGFAVFTSSDTSILLQYVCALVLVELENCLCKVIEIVFVLMGF